MRKKILLLANTSWYLFNFRISLIDQLIKENYEVILVSPVDQYTTELNKRKIKFIEWGLKRRSINPLLEIKSIFMLIRIYKEQSPSLVHHFTIKGCLYGSISTKFVKNIKIINHITGLGPSFFSKVPLVRIINFLIRPIYKMALKSKNSKVLFHNEDDRLHLTKLGIIKYKNSLTVKGSGVDVNYFSLNERKKSFNETPQILFPARVIREKGFFELFNACKMLWAENYNFILNIAGNIDQGNLSSLTQREINLVNNNARVVFHGCVVDIRRLYELTDVVVLPSWREGLSRSLLEASSMELPIITTNVPGCREIVEHEVSGLLVPLKDQNKLKEAIRFLLDNEDTAIKYGRRARNKIASEYSIGKVNSNIIEIYKSLID